MPQRKATSKSTYLRDMGRLLRPLDVCYFIGNFLLRRSLRMTLGAAGVGLAGLASRLIGFQGLTVKQAIGLPLLIGGAMLLVGAVLKLAPLLYSSHYATIAAANDLNLMEDHRKNERDTHLALIWDRVIRHEQEARYSRAEREEEERSIAEERKHIHQTIRRLEDRTKTFLGIQDEEEETDEIAAAMIEARPLSGSLEKSREGFLISAKYALRKSLPQCVEEQLVGFRLELYEDWCDGAYFDLASDAKLREQYAGNSALQAAKRRAGMGLRDTLRYLPSKLARQLWFGLALKYVDVQVGGLIEKFNKKYDTDFFGAQVFLWPDERIEQALLDHFPKRGPAILEEVKGGRTVMFRRIFDTTQEHAETMLNRMLHHDLAVATHLRAKYDPEYVLGSLGCGLLSDVEEEGLGERERQRAKTLRHYTEQEQEALRGYVQKHHPDLLAQDNPQAGLAFRAVRIACHTNQGGMKAVAAGASDGKNPKLDKAIEDAAAEEEEYARELFAVRMHHALALLQLRGYKQLVADLGIDEAAEA